MSNTTTFLPCPFCGSSHLTIETYLMRSAVVLCLDCGAQGPKRKDWNDRAVTDPLGDAARESFKR